MSTLSDTLVSYIEKYGWLSVASIYFHDGLTVHPHTQHGCACLSKSKGLLIAGSRMDSAYSEVFESEFFVSPRDRIGFQQSFVVASFDSLLHWDFLRFNHDMFYNFETEVPVPQIPSRATIEGMTKDEETGLYPGTDTIEIMDGSLISSIPLYPNEDRPDQYYGLRVDGYKEWYRRQTLYKQAIGTMLGITDLI